MSSEFIDKLTGSRVTNTGSTTIGEVSCAVMSFSHPWCPRLNPILSHVPIVVDDDFGMRFIPISTAIFPVGVEFDVPVVRADTICPSLMCVSIPVDAVVLPVALGLFPGRRIELVGAEPTSPGTKRGRSNRGDDGANLVIVGFVAKEGDPNAQLLVFDEINKSSQLLPGGTRCRTLSGRHGLLPAIHANMELLLKSHALPHHVPAAAADAKPSVAGVTAEEPSGMGTPTPSEIPEPTGEKRDYKFAGLDLDWSDLPCQTHSVLIRRGGGAKEEVTPIDIDTERCERYIGCWPGQMVWMKATKKRAVFLGIAAALDGEHIDMVVRPLNETYSETVRPGTEMWILVEEMDSIGPSMDDPAAVSEHLDRASSTIEYQESTDFSDRAETRREFQQYVQKIHLDALQHVRKTQEELASSGDAKKSRVLRAIQTAGFADPELVLYQIHRFLNVETPLISWFKPFREHTGRDKQKVISLMLKDIQMRNLFETAIGNGLESTSARTGWEKRLFGPPYDTATPAQRVKYGVVNLFNDPGGQNACGGQYGDCYMVFGGGAALRERTTITPKDSSDSGCVCCTLDHGMTLVLAEVDEHDTQRLAKLACGKLAYVASESTQYREIQIHGDVFFHHHITHVVINDAYVKKSDDLILMLAMAVKNGWWLVTQKAMAHMAALRLETRDNLVKQLELYGGISGWPGIGKHGMPPPQHLAGPQLADLRPLYDELCHRICQVELMWLISRVA